MLMELMPKEMEQKMPSLGSTEDVPLEEKQVLVKFFCPAFTWYGVEYSAQDKLFFGFVANERDPMCSEWGYFSLGELEQLQKNPPYPYFTMERDLYFKEAKAKEIDGIQT